MSVSIEKLKKLRKYGGWLQERLVEISGLSLITIQRIETSGNASLESHIAVNIVIRFDICRINFTSFKASN